MNFSNSSFADTRKSFTIFGKILFFGISHHSRDISFYRKNYISHLRRSKIKCEGKILRFFRFHLLKLNYGTNEKFEYARIILLAQFYYFLNFLVSYFPCKMNRICLPNNFTTFFCWYKFHRLYRIIVVPKWTAISSSGCSRDPIQNNLQLPQRVESSSKKILRMDCSETFYRVPNDYESCLSVVLHIPNTNRQFC